MVGMEKVNSSFSVLKSPIDKIAINVTDFDLVPHKRF